MDDSFAVGSDETVSSLTHPESLSPVPSRRKNPGTGILGPWSEGVVGGGSLGCGADDVSDLALAEVILLYAALTT